MVVNFLMAAAGSGGYIYSRVLMARLTTKGNTAQHFGFMAGVSRVSGLYYYSLLLIFTTTKPAKYGTGIIGPLIYGWVVYVSGSRTVPILRSTLHSEFYQINVLGH
jgi:MFS-type transporter involved in bile tolerance (Atg22 family)